MFKRKKSGLKAVCLAVSSYCFASSSLAADLLSQSLTGDVADSLGSGSMFWKIFILIDIILATAMAVKSKNPMVFMGVAAIAFIPAFLIKTFVF